MKTNILKSFVAMLAIAATVCFAGCKDDESDEDIIPNIAIAESTMSFTNAEETKTLALESNADWQAVVPESADWVTVNPMSGNGDKTVTIAVAENTTGKAREAEVKFSALHPTYGVYDTKKLTIIQSANETEVEEENVIYSDNFDKVKAEEGEKGWPWVDTKEGDAYVYANPQGSAAANVTYSREETKVSVRSNGKQSDDSGYSSYSGSGVNRVYFGSQPTRLVVGNIALPADQQNYVLSFGANYYDYNKTDNTFNKAEFVVSVSKNGVAWTPIEYSFKEGVDLNGKWNLATASLKLAEVPEALYIKFEALVNSTIGIDDIKLSTGGAGEQEVVFAEAPVIEDIEGTVTEVLEAEQGANVKAIDATVVAVSAKAYLLTDGTSYILAYMSEGAPEVAVGDKVTVEGEMSEHNGVPQIANPVATKTGTVENFAHPEATVIDGAALDAYKDNFAIKYVKIADANLVKKDNKYWNFTVEGATTATGSLADPTAEMCPESNHAKKVDIYGYVVYISGGQYVNVIVTSIEVKGEGEEPAGPSEELGDDERYLSDEGLMITENGDVKAYANAVTIEGKKYPALKLGTSKVVGSWTTAKVGVEGDYTLSFYAFGWSGTEAEVTVTVDGETVLTVQPIANANISGSATNFPVTVDQENNFYSVELKGLTAESTITFATTEGKYRAVLFGIQLNQPETSEPVEMTPAAVAEGYQGAKVTWEAVEGAEAYVVSVVGNDAITPVEVAGDKTEAVITGLADARKYTFAVEAIDAEENVIGEGETAETEVYTLVNWVEPTFEFAMSEDKTTYHLYAKDLAATNYFYVGAEVNIYKDGATTPIYTLKHAHGDAWLEGAYQYARYLLGNVNQNKGWYWYDGEGNPVTKKDDGSAKEVNEVPASFFTAGEYTFDYEIAYGVCVNGTWAKDGGNYTSVAVDKAEADRVYFVTVDNLLRDADNHIERHSAGIETPVALATIAPTLEFTSVTAKAEGYQGAKIEWSAVETADAYKVVVNGTEVEANGELSHTVAPETLTDANEYTFTVKAYKGTELLATGEATTQVFTLTNVVEPKVTFDGTTLHVGDCLDLHGVVVDIKVEFVKGGQTVHTATYTKDTKAYNEGGVAGYLNSGKCTVGLFDDFIPASATSQPNWVWNGTESATAPTFEPGTYSIKWTANYYTIVNAYWTTQVNGAYPKDQFKTKAEAVAANAGKARILFENPANDVLVQAIERTGTATDYVVEDPDAEPVVLNAKAAIDEGTRPGRELFGNTDTDDKIGVASINGMLESVKLSWDAVEADKIVIAYNGQTVEVEGTATEKVIEGLKTSPVEFTISAVKGSDTIAEEKVSSDVYVLPDAAAGTWVGKYVDGKDGVLILGTGWNTKQYCTANCTFNVYEKGSDVAVFTKDITTSNNNNAISWAMSKTYGVRYSGPGNQACHGGDGNNWADDTDDNNSDKVVMDDRNFVFQGLDYSKEYVVKYTLKVWPYIFDADNANNKEPYQSGTNTLMNYFFKKMMIGGTLDTYYDAVELKGESDLTFEGVPEVVALATPVVEAAVEGNVVTLSWAAVEGAAKYRVSVGDETTEVEETTFEYEGEYETEYTFTVVAVAADTTKNTDSEPATATATTEAAPAPAIEKITIAEFLAKADTETVYELTGKITKIDRQETYSNFYINDGTADLYIYGLLDNGDKETLKKKGILVGDEVTLQGVYVDYNGTKEIKDATYISHKVATWPWITAVDPAQVSFEATGGNEDIAVTLRNGEGATPSLTGLTAPFSATWDANGVVKVACENTADAAEQTLTIAFADGNSATVKVSKVAAGQAAQKVATISFADKANRTSYSTSEQVWEQNGIKVTNNKASSTSNVGDYYNPARFYKSSSLKIEAPGKIVSIAVDVKNVPAANVAPWGTAVDGVVTIECDGTSNTYSISSMSAQARANSFTVTYTE